MKMQASINKIAWTAVAVGGAAAAAAVTAGFFSSIKAASDLQETTSKFNTVFGSQKKVAEEWSKVLVESYFMSTNEAKKYLSSVQDLLVPMGMQEQAAAKMSYEVVKLSADLGSFNNLPTAQVMNDITSALSGNYETMKKYGSILNVTVVQEKALAMGLAGTKAELTAGAKAQAAYALMVQHSKAAIGDQIRTASSLANQIKQLESQFKNLAAYIGTHFIPVISGALLMVQDIFGNQSTMRIMEQKRDRLVGLVSDLEKKVNKIFPGGDILKPSPFHSAWLEKQKKELEIAKQDLKLTHDSILMMQGKLYQRQNKALAKRLVDEEAYAANIEQLTQDIELFMAQHQEEVTQIAADAQIKRVEDHRMALAKKLADEEAYAANIEQLTQDIELFMAQQQEEVTQIAADAQIKRTEDAEAANKRQLESLLWFTRSAGGLFNQLFNDIWEGELKSAEDYFKQFLKNILASWVDTLGQMAAQRIGLALFGGGTSTAAGIVGAAGNAAGGGVLGEISSVLGLGKAAAAVKGWLGIGGTGAGVVSASSIPASSLPAFASEGLMAGGGGIAGGGAGAGFASVAGVAVPVAAALVAGKVLSNMISGQTHHVAGGRGPVALSELEDPTAFFSQQIRNEMAINRAKMTQGMDPDYTWSNYARSLNIRVQVGNQEFETYISDIADDVRVTAERRGLGSDRAYM